MRPFSDWAAEAGCTDASSAAASALAGDEQAAAWLSRWLCACAPRRRTYLRVDDAAARAVATLADALGTSPAELARLRAGDLRGRELSAAAVEAVRCLLGDRIPADPGDFLLDGWSPRRVRYALAKAVREQKAERAA